MVLKHLLSALIGKAQVVEKLAESRPIREAAKMTAYAVMKAQVAGKNAATKALQSNTVRQIRQETSELPRDIGDLGRKAERLRDSVMKDVKEGVDDVKRQIRHKSK